MKHTCRILLAICAGALLIRLVLLPTIPHPGFADPNYYYDLGLSLVEGRGFTIDFLWQYNNPPQTIVHEMDYWMPLNGVIVAASFALFGINVVAAILPFALLGAILPLVAFAAAKQFDSEDESALFAAACTAVLPELLLHSLRSETTLPNALFTGGAVLLLTYGFKRGKFRAFLAAGLLAGLAYLIRSDAALLLPVLAGTLAVYYLNGKGPARQNEIHQDMARHVPLVKISMYAAGGIVIALIVIVPWLIRNQGLFGTPTTPNLNRMFFLTDHDEHFAYNDEFTLETMLAAQTPGQLIGKRLFELAAAFKTMVASLDMFLAVAVFGGFLLLCYRRDRERLLTLTPVLLLLLGLLIFYPILVPMKSQGGSFKKAYLALIPLLLPLAGYALEQAVTSKRLRCGVMVMVVVMTGAFAVDAVRLDAQFLRDYILHTEKIVTTANRLPDVTGDGRVRLMTRDPFMMSYYGIQSVMTPRDDRDAVLEVAQRYEIDYLLVPTARPALDAALVDKTVSDPRFQFVTDIPGTELSFYTFAPEAK